jgi:hypothetical protein
VKGRPRVWPVGAGASYVVNRLKKSLVTILWVLALINAIPYPKPSLFNIAQ